MNPDVIMKKLTSLLLILCLTGCAADRSSLDTYQKTARMDNNLVEKYQQANSITEEYVSRIAKRVSMVNDRPSDNFTINVLKTQDVEYSLDPETRTIIISQGALNKLKDEAELATILTVGMARIDNSPNIDRETATLLYKAGYDPQAMLDLQEQYFYRQQNWLSEVFPYPPTPGSITANQTMIEKMPKGLLRGSENYNQQING